MEKPLPEQKHSIRFGWAEAARKMREREDDLLLDTPTATRFDEEEWEWCESHAHSLHADNTKS